MEPPETARFDRSSIGAPTARANAAAMVLSFKALSESARYELEQLAGLILHDCDCRPDVIAPAAVREDRARNVRQDAAAPRGHAREHVAHRCALRTDAWGQHEGMRQRCDGFVRVGAG